MIPTFSSPCLGSQSRLLAKIEREGWLAPCSQFTLGDEDAVLARSRPLILDPLLVSLGDMSSISIYAEPSSNWRSWTVGLW